MTLLLISRWISIGEKPAIFYILGQSPPRTHQQVRHPTSLHIVLLPDRSLPHQLHLLLRRGSLWDYQPQPLVPPVISLLDKTTPIQQTSNQDSLLLIIAVISQVNDWWRAYGFIRVVSQVDNIQIRSPRTIRFLTLRNLIWRRRSFQPWDLTSMLSGRIFGAHSTSLGSSPSLSTRRSHRQPRHTISPFDSTITILFAERRTPIPSSIYVTGIRVSRACLEFCGRIP